MGEGRRGEGHFQPAFISNAARCLAAEEFVLLRRNRLFAFNLSFPFSIFLFLRCGLSLCVSSSILAEKDFGLIFSCRTGMKINAKKGAGYVR